RLRAGVPGPDRGAERIPTPELNRFLVDVVAATPPPARRGGKRLRLYYIAQIGTAPPRFAVQVNSRRLTKHAWASLIATSLRDAYGSDGVPLVIDFVPRRRGARTKPGRARTR